MKTNNENKELNKDSNKDLNKDLNKGSNEDLNKESNKDVTKKTNKESNGKKFKKIDFKEKVLRSLIPQSSAMTAPCSREPKLSLSHLR